MTQPETTSTDGATPTEPEKPAQPTGDAWETSAGKGGKAAVLADLAAVREENRRLAEQFEPLKPLLAALAPADQAAGKTEVQMLTERFEAQEREIAAERAGRLRAEIASEKGLTAAQAKRLVGATREELEADADDLLSILTAGRPAGPRPDPSQGAKGSTAQPDLDAQIREAQAKGDLRAVIALQNQKLAKSST